MNTRSAEGTVNQRSDDGKDATRDGEALAFEAEQIEQFTPLVHKCARRWSGFLNYVGYPDDIEGVAQEGFIGLLRAIRTYEDGHGATRLTWYARIIAQHFMLLRKHLTCMRRTAPPRSDLWIGQDSDSPGEWIAAPALAEPVDERLSGALASLEQRDREVLLARFSQDLRLADVGRAWGVTGERIRQLEVRALDRLRQAIARTAS